MRRIALLGLALTLANCGTNTWWNPPFTTGFGPNVPDNDSPNVRRVMGDRSSPDVLTTEPGDIWPGPLPPTPTLQDLQEKSALGEATPLGAPQPVRGSSTPPWPVALPPRAALPAAPAYVPAKPPPRDAAGQVYQTPSGPVVTTGGTQNYKTTTMPGGGSAIIVPNGNGTSTIIHADGKIETVLTPR